MRAKMESKMNLNECHRAVLIRVVDHRGDN